MTREMAGREDRMRRGGREQARLGGWLGYPGTASCAWARSVARVSKITNHLRGPDRWGCLTFLLTSPPGIAAARLRLGERDGDDLCGHQAGIPAPKSHLLHPAGFPATVLPSHGVGQFFQASQANGLAHTLPLEKCSNLGLATCLPAGRRCEINEITQPVRGA